jgi:HEPN domain-containing protein
MRELPDNNYDEARRWLKNTDDDLRAMRAVLRDPDAPGRIISFMAHLAAEKALKATLIDAGVPFKKTHDLVALHAMCVRSGRLADIDTGQLALLSPWGVDGRYADDLVDAERALASRLAEFAESLVEAVRQILEATDGDE